MYKRKLFYFGLTTGLILLVALLSAVLSAHFNRENLKQSNIAQSLLFEHERLSGMSYRLFKQLTDEVILGQGANQAFVRNKRALIGQSLDTIKELELAQREALGIQYTMGSVEDTDELEMLIDEITSEFQIVVTANGVYPLKQQARLRSLLEVTIDDQFRELINSAITRQSSVVTLINAQINSLNSAIVWFTAGLGVLSLSIIFYGCFWLFNQLYQPIILIRNATNAIASGEYDKPISETLDEEFEELASAINQLAKRLKEHEFKETTSRKQLELDVKQRTRELTKANLELTKIDTRRRQFIADVSHELRTPLTIIRGEAQVTLRMQTANQEDVRETLTSILEQAVNLSQLVDDLLLLTRAEMHQIQLQLAPVNLFDLVTAEVSRWQRHCEDRVISINASKQSEKVEALIDKPRIQQVLSILIDNATKYSKTGGSVDIGIAQRSAQLVITVSDTGDGISATQVENIFERFVRFSRHDEGLGLGLPIAKAIIEAHGGQIVVESIQGEGAIFSIILPTADA
ncbi:MAG: two-component system OmpR family sensor kinase [Halieaceae bacterium]|jgi:two-component system OmpR family sensor kinase